MCISWRVDMSTFKIVQQFEGTTYDLLCELLKKKSIDMVVRNLFIHKGTFNRWILKKDVPDNYFNDINFLLENKYIPKDSYRQKDQFYTTKKISVFCYQTLLKVLKSLGIDESLYTYIEPSAGCCNFFSILPKNRRIGIDIEPKGDLKNELIESNYLNYFPKKGGKYIVLGNPPFGLRGNLALRFINHSYEFADVVAFILPPLFNSTGKGVPMKRIVGYELAYTEKLPSNSFEYPDGKPVDVSTIFQVWTRINTDKIKKDVIKTCNSFVKIYSLSDGGTPSSTRNKAMIGKCDAYLPSTCFSGMKLYKDFEKLPNRRGYGVVFLKDKQKLKNLFNHVDWKSVAFLSTNNALNLRMDLIEREVIKGGFYD